MAARHLALHMKRKPSFKTIHGHTHFLRIPLSTSTSRPMICEAFRKIIGDPISSTVPKAAFQYPEQLHITIGALNLHTPQRIDQALALLHSIDVGSMLENAFRPPIERNSYGGTIDLSALSILDVTMQGLFVHPKTWNLAKAIDLMAKVYDVGGLLPQICADIRQRFLDADPHVGFKRSLPTHFPFMPTTVVTTKRIEVGVKNAKPSSIQRGLYKKKVASFDSNSVVSKYHDMIWVKHFRLEKLELCERGLQDIVRDGKLISRGFKEIGSISLPGAPISQAEPWIKGGTYVKNRPPPPSSLYKPVSRSLSDGQRRSLSAS